LAPAATRVKCRSASGPSKDLKEAREQQAATAEILKVIASSPSDVQPVFEAIAASAKRLIGGFSAAVFRFVDEVGRLAAFTPTRPAADEVWQASIPRRLSDFPPFEWVRGGEAAQVPDVEASPDVRDLGRLRGFRSLLVTPLMSSGVVIGMVSVTRAETGTFADHHVQLLQTFADQAVIAIENARLFDEVQKRTVELSESLEYQMATSDLLGVISRSPNALKPVLQTLAESALGLCGALSATVLLRDGDVLIPRAHVGPLLAPLGERQALHRGWVTGRAVLDAVTIHLPDLLETSESEYPFGKSMALKYGHHATLAAPLVREGTAIGAILVRRREPRPFSQRQITLLETFADQAIIAIENTRLFEQVQERTRQLSKSLDDLRTAQDRLVQTQKLASLGQLTAGIAHEIKNPLNFVNNFSALSAELVGEMKDALSDINLDKNKRDELDEIAQLLKDNLEKVVQHGKRADSIVKNMLQHSREGSGENRPADINAIVDESLNLAYHGARAEKAGFSIVLQRDLDPSVGMADVYPQEITRVLLNLISNGFYATTKRKVEADDGFEPMLSATTKNLGAKVEIRIRDNGTGIPEEVREKIFNPFFTTKPSGEGTGLGLSMSYDIIVKQHGGSIDVETVSGLFTEFKIVLPRGTSRK
jgi:two-component system NtrC family sensor kinase